MWPAARILNVVLGVWLFFSAFLWRHTTAQMTNTWILGVLFAMFGILSIGVPVVRYFSMALSVWLFISAFALNHISIATVANNAIVALVLFVLSLAPGRGEATIVTTRRPQHV